VNQITSGKNPLDQEGVTKFDLRFTRGAACPSAWIESLNAWRTRLHELRLIGQDPGRYGGIGFGNVSCRVPPGAHGRFLVSGTQTGHLPVLGAQHYSLVTRADVAANRIEAEGPVAPSSESLTHAVLYGLDARIACVLHVHSPAIWQSATRLGLPATPGDAPYGTPAMAEAVGRLHRAGRLRGGVFVMAGHEDGVVAFGDGAEAAGRALLAALERAPAFPLSEKRNDGDN
jgi:ribulose-5-phosphate 4-epimerase/fuculose-1-phosphate aldolase